MEEQQNHFTSSLNQEAMKISLKTLRENFKQEAELAANSAKTATFEKKCSQISHFSRILHEENKVELQFLRDERAAIREYDAGMPRKRAEYLSVLDVPGLPPDSNDQKK
jgi:protein subunit release factor A